MSCVHDLANGTCPKCIDCDSFGDLLRANGHEDLRLETKERRDLRAMLTRALTAQGWAVACALDARSYQRWSQAIEDPGFSPFAVGQSNGLAVQVMVLAALPAPADVVDEMLGPEKK